MKTEYSVECEVCGNYNISPIKCESCWRKEIQQAERKRFDKFVSLIQAKVFMDWKGRNEFIDWLKKKTGEKLK